jgi:hypothetical protein
MGVNGKNKGSSWEREVVRIFKELYKHDGFERNAFSGSLYGGSNRFRMSGKDKSHTGSVVGDIIVPSAFPMTLECKAYKELDFHNIIQGSSKVLDEWIRQAEEDSKSVEKDFVLIIKINNKGIFVVTKNLPMGVKKLTDNLISYTKYKEEYYMYSLAQFKTVAASFDNIIQWHINKDKEV